MKKTHIFKPATAIADARQ